MIKRRPFGSESADALEVGDLVQWSTWRQEIDEWEYHHGIITEIREEIKGNRLVSISMVRPLEGHSLEKKFFTPSLRLISSANQSTKNM